MLLCFLAVGRQAENAGLNLNFVQLLQLCPKLYLLILMVNLTSQQSRTFGPFTMIKYDLLRSQCKEIRSPTWLRGHRVRPPCHVKYYRIVIHKPLSVPKFNTSKWNNTSCSSA